MKDIVKQFKESISKLTPEEFKKIWNEIKWCSQSEIDYPVFNTQTNYFEYKINNTETLEKVIEKNCWNTITACEDSDNTNIKYVEELINTSFINGINFAQRWTYIEDELPQYYQNVLADNGEYMAVVARVSDGDEDFYPICGTHVYMYPDPIKWKFVTLK